MTIGGTTMIRLAPRSSARSNSARRVRSDAQLGEILAGHHQRQGNDQRQRGRTCPQGTRLVRIARQTRLSRSSREKVGRQPRHDGSSLWGVATNSRPRMIVAQHRARRRPCDVGLVKASRWRSMEAEALLRRGALLRLQEQQNSDGQAELQ